MGNPVIDEIEQHKLPLKPYAFARVLDAYAEVVAASLNAQRENVRAHDAIMKLFNDGALCPSKL